MEIISRKEAREKGLSRFYSGKPCPYGHVVERCTANGTCVECSRSRTRKSSVAWRQKNKEKIAARMKAYHKRLRETDKEWRESTYRKTREWREKNKDHLKAYSSERKRKYRKEYTIHENNRRLKKLLNGGEVILQDVENINKKQGYVCATPVCKVSTREKYHIDHRVPISKGGRNSPENIDILCPSCNCRKNARMPDEWRRISAMEKFV